MKTLQYFTLDEFRCPCCGKADMDPGFVEALDSARDFAGRAFRITSGYRCEAHNITVGGLPRSSHLNGFAADIACSDPRTRYKIINGCLTVGFTRFEIGPMHVHVDRDPTKLPWVIDLASEHRSDAHKGGV